MATITKTFTENEKWSTDVYAKHTLVLPFPNKTITQALDNTRHAIEPTSITDQINSKADNRAKLGAWIDLDLRYNGTSILRVYYTRSVYDSAYVTTKPVTLSEVFPSSSTTFRIASVFNSSNKTSRTATVDVYMMATETYLITVTSDDYLRGRYKPSSNTKLGSYTLTLNAPPSFQSSSLSYSTAHIYAGYTTANLSVSDITAKYDGYITKIEFAIGSQKHTKNFTENNQPGATENFAIALNAGGTFTPTVTVTDSRGQTTTKSYNEVTVSPYVPPTVSFTVQRADSSGDPTDEGESALAEATFVWDSEIETLSAPTVTATDLDGTVVPITTTWYKDSALTQAVSDWSALTSADMPIYGLIDNSGHNAFNTQYSYQITIDPQNGNIPITQTLGSAFYTIDFLAGGHGIAFGQPSSEDGFVCNMESTFNEESEYVLDVDASAGEFVDATSGADKGLFNGIRCGGLFNVVLDNMKLKLKGFLSRLYNGTLGLNEIIPDNSNLNDYKAFGRYGVANATSAGTMTNAPTTASGFVLEVAKGQNDSTIVQTAYPYTGGTCYRRGYNTNNQIWTAWIRPNEFIVENVSIGSGTIASATAENLSVSVAKTGYTPIGIVGVKKTGQTYGAVSISRFNIDGTTAYVSIYNNYSSARTYTVSADILYQRT